MKEAGTNFDAAFLVQVAAKANQVYFIYQINKQQLRYLNEAVYPFGKYLEKA